MQLIYTHMFIQMHIFNLCAYSCIYIYIQFIYIYSIYLFVYSRSRPSTCTTPRRPCLTRRVKLVKPGVCAKLVKPGGWAAPSLGLASMLGATYLSIYIIWYHIMIYYNILYYIALYYRRPCLTRRVRATPSEWPSSRLITTYLPILFMYLFTRCAEFARQRVWAAAPSLGLGSMLGANCLSIYFMLYPSI